MKARYVKVILFEMVKTNLQDSKVVGQGQDYLLLERPQPKKSVTGKTRAKKVIDSHFADVAEG